MRELPRIQIRRISNVSPDIPHKTDNELETQFMNDFSREYWNDSMKI